MAGVSGLLGFDNTGMSCEGRERGGHGRELALERRACVLRDGCHCLPLCCFGGRNGRHLRVEEVGLPEIEPIFLTFSTTTGPFESGLRG
jgi:hypothetical protein